jgi:hypothetical protein
MTSNQLVQRARMSDCKAFCYGGPTATLEAVAIASINLAPLAYEGDLHATIAGGPRTYETIRYISHARAA